MARLQEKPARTYTKEDWSDLYHTAPDALAGRYMSLFWQPVHRSEDLQPGKAKPIRIMSDDFTLYRSQTGVPHLVGFRCAHRNTQLSIGWVEGDNIRCRYHGWTYGPDGQCVEQPGEPDPFCQKVRIDGYPTEEYLGLIFAYLGEGDPPPLPRYPDFEGPGLLEATTYVRACNYFNSMDNDDMHTYFVHRQAGSWEDWEGDVPTLSANETEFGMTCYRTWRGKVFEGQSRAMPNISYRLATPTYSRRHGTPATDNIAWRVPIDDESHITFNVGLVHIDTDEQKQHHLEQRRLDHERGFAPEEEAAIIARILAGELSLDEVELPPGQLITLQDHVTQGAQGAIYDRNVEHLGREDVSVILWRKIRTRELQALAEGRPLKRWSIPGRTAGLKRGHEVSPDLASEERPRGPVEADIGIR